MTIKRTLRRPDVQAKTGLSRTSIYNLERAGDFPQHFMLSPRVAVWDEGQVDAWLASRQQTPAKATAGPDQSLRKTFPGRGKARPLEQAA